MALHGGAAPLGFGFFIGVSPRVLLKPLREMTMITDKELRFFTQPASKQRAPKGLKKRVAQEVIHRLSGVLLADGELQSYPGSAAPVFTLEMDIGGLHLTFWMPLLILPH